MVNKKGNIVCKFLTVLIPILSFNLFAKELLLFGGNEHEEFLGCLTCNEFSSESICNGYGTYGNEFSTDGIWNEFSGFGNEFSPKSPWNEFSSDNSVPVVVDREGNFYGYFTINEYRSNSVNFSSNLKEWYDSYEGDLEKVRISLCTFFGKSG